MKLSNSQVKPQRLWTTYFHILIFMFYYHAISFSLIFIYLFCIFFILCLYTFVINIDLFHIDIYFYYYLCRFLHILCFIIYFMCTYNFLFNFIYYLISFCYVPLKNYQALLILSIFLFDVFYILLESSNSVYDVYKILHENLKKNNCSARLQMCLIRLLSYIFHILFYKLVLI